MRRILGRGIHRSPAASSSSAAAMGLTAHNSGSCSALTSSLHHGAAASSVTMCSSSSSLMSSAPVSYQVRCASTAPIGGGVVNAEGAVVSTEDDGIYISALRHVVAELPTNGIRLIDLVERLKNVLGSDEQRVDPKTYGFETMLEALVAVNDTHYIAGDVIVPCDWESVMTRVRAKLPPGGVLEPAFVRYINAEGCPRFKRASLQSNASKEIDGDEDAKSVDPVLDEAPVTARQRLIARMRAELKADNPLGSSLPGVAMHDWVATHFNKLIDVVDVTPPSVVARATAQGIPLSGIPRTFVYRPIEEVHPFVNVLRTAFKCLGCTRPQHMPVAVPLQDIAAIVPVLPINPKTSHTYTWPEFLRLPEVQAHFDTKVSVYVAEQKATQTQLIFIDGTTLLPDEAEAAVHQWRDRRSKELGNVPIRIQVVVLRREDDPPHTRDDILIDGYVVEPVHAVMAHLALVADTGAVDADAHATIGMAPNSGGRGAAAASNSISDDGSSAAGGWSSVSASDASPTSSAPSSSSLSAPSPSSSSSAVGKALFNTEDEVEASVAAELSTQLASAMGESSTEHSADATSAAGSADGILSVAGSLTVPILPASCFQDVVVLVGSRESKESVDAGLADANAKRHWIRTMLVIGEE